MTAECLAKSAKNLIPWKLRYRIKLTEARHPGFIPDILKQKSEPVHYNDVFYQALETMGIESLEEKVICEMGPGQFLSHAFLAYQLGAAGSYLLEIGDFAGQDRYVKMNQPLLLKEENRRIRSLPKLGKAVTWNEYLKLLNAQYYTDGIDGYRRVPDLAADYVFSFSVMEHIRKNVFRETMREMYRMMKYGGLSYHTVDLKDHFGGGKNHLRFSETDWEDSSHYSMDNYTNRISCSKLVSIWKETGFSVVSLKRERMDKRKLLRRSQLHPVFSDMSDKDLMTGSFTVVLKKEKMEKLEASQTRQWTSQR